MYSYIVIRFISQKNTLITIKIKQNNEYFLLPLYGAGRHDMVAAL